MRTGVATSEANPQTLPGRLKSSHLCPLTTFQVVPDYLMGENTYGSAIKVSRCLKTLGVNCVFETGRGTALVGEVP